MKSRFLTLILASVFFLSACGSKEEETDSAKDGKKETDSELTTTSNQLSRDYYRALIQDGAYKTSKSRGITQKLNSTFNLKAFETGLIQLSQEKFESDVYYFQEGQYLDSKTINQWLGRFNPKKGDDQNLEGLNPKNNGKQEPDQRAPIYLNSILEQDYIKKDKEEYKTSGISIGLAMNTTDYYQKEKYGAYFETKISHNEVVKQGKQMANKVVERIRKIEGLEKIPVVIGIFEQSAEDSLAGGTYVASGISENGNPAIGDWKNINTKKVIFPSGGSDSNEKSSFSNFKSEVENFFPNLSGITAEAKYTDDQLVGMSINIETQFYGESEVIAFTQHVNDKADKLLPPNIPIEITISSIKGIESFLDREPDQHEFYSHIFD